MAIKPQFYLVNPKALPEVFEKVMQAKTLLNHGQAKTSCEACQKAGLSRSAFYKYKDMIFPYEDQTGRQIITLGMTLMDEPGVLSGVLAALYQSKANLLTVNQNIPNDGLANVTVSIILDDEQTDIHSVIQSISRLNGVVKIKMI